MPRILRPLTLAAGLLGGMAWVANLFVDAAALSWAGSILLTLGAALIGAGMARMAWVAAVATAGTAALWWALVDFARDIGGPTRVVEGVLGAGAALLVGVATLTARPSLGREAPSHGRHESARGPGNHRG